MQQAFRSECQDPSYVRIDDKLKQTFLDTHNKLRNHQALGENESVLKPQVADMATMVSKLNFHNLYVAFGCMWFLVSSFDLQQWDDELELMSLTNIMQCKMVADQCRRTANYKEVGQNLYELCSSSNYSPIGRVIDFAIKSWFDEYHEISHLSEEHFVEDSGLAKSGRFLQVVKSNADRIGCSAIQYRDTRSHHCTVIGCNYNAGSIVDVPTYEIGPTASRCKTGTNPKYSGLCSENEDYSKHEYADVFFTNDSPVVVEWLKNRKRLNTGGEIVRYSQKDDQL